MPQFLHNLISLCKQILAGAKEIKNLRLSHLRKVFSLMDRREKTILGLLLLLAIINCYISLRNVYHSHSVVVAGTGGSYTEAMVGQPNFINPLLASAEPDMSLVRLVFSGLYKYDNNGSLIPDLAENLPEISQDQKQYTIHLRKNVRWHNSQPLSADDVIFTMQVLQDPSYKSPLRGMWQSTLAEKIDDYTVRFTTKDVVGPFVYNLTLPILPKSVWSNIPAANFAAADFNLKAVGSGPYSVKEIKKQASGKVSQISLSAFADFYEGQAKISNIILKFYDSDEDAEAALRSSEVDGFGFVTPGSNLRPNDNIKDAQVITLPLPQYQAIFFNLDSKILNDGNVRKALSLATNRDQIINDVFAGHALLPTPPLLNPKGLTATPETGQANVDAAIETLERVGWRINPKTNIREKKNQKLEFTLSTTDSPANAKAAQALSDQWGKLNISVKIELLPTKQLTDAVLRPRNFDALLFPEKFNIDPDPFAFWHSSQIKDPGFNLTGFSDSKVDKLIIQARGTTSLQSREQLYEQIHQLISEQYTVILLDQGIYNYIVDNKIKNIGLKTIYDPRQRFYDVANWYIKESRVWK